MLPGATLGIACVIGAAAGFLIGSVGKVVRCTFGRLAHQIDEGVGGIILVPTLIQLRDVEVRLVSMLASAWASQLLLYWLDSNSHSSMYVFIHLRGLGGGAGLRASQRDQLA